MNNQYGLFSVYGIEIEYMLVEKTSLRPLPIADRLIQKMHGSIVNEIDCGSLSISNELALHVIEFKTNGPKSSLASLSNDFHQLIQKVQNVLETFNAWLLPTGTHPFLIPDQSIPLWPHGDRQIYQAFDRIFDCNGHGWTNLQSTHINLPFKNDEEFDLLHNTIRLFLPLLPALSASTPLLEGKLTGLLDTRLEFYGKNQIKLPIISGDIIPEMISSQKMYEEKILNPIYQAIAPYDPEGILQKEWLNSRGAIARFDRNAIEIRLMDTQECPKADLACVSAIVGILKHWIKTYPLEKKTPLCEKEGRRVYEKVIKSGLKTEIDSKEYLKAIGYSKSRKSAEAVLFDCIEKSANEMDFETQQYLEKILKEGNLADRMLKALGAVPNKEKIKSLYYELAACLTTNEYFRI